ERQTVRRFLPKGCAIRCEKDHLIIGPFALQALDDPRQRLRHHDHAGTAAKLIIIDLPMLIRCIIPKVMQMYFQQAFIPGTLQDRVTEGAFQQLWHDRDNINSHVDPSYLNGCCPYLISDGMRIHLSADSIE